MSTSPGPQQSGGRRPSTSQIRLLSQSIALEEGRPPAAAKFATLACATMFFGAVVWAAVTNVEKIAIASGQVLPSGLVQSVQHFEGGIVQAILAKEGELVDRGDVLYRLDPTAAQAELDQLRAREAALTLQIERLRAFAERRAPQLNTGGTFGLRLANDQLTILRKQEESRDNQRLVLERQIGTRRAELASLEEQRVALDGQLRIVGRNLSMRRELVEKGLISRIVFNDTEREHVRVKGELAQTLSNMRRASEAIAESEARLLEVESKLASESLNEMGNHAAELAQVRESLARARDRVTRLEIRAPLRGLVKDMRIKTIGGVIAPGAVIVDVVPVSGDLVAEIKISPRDIGHVRVGQEVITKVTAFDFARYGTVPGSLKSFSATTFQDNDGQVYYKGIVELARNHVGAQAGRNPLLPGMVVQADIRLGDRSVLEYLFTPVYASLAAAFHER
jgi:HlyD family secretion protein/adhesin transport system membrane fusion protein